MNPIYRHIVAAAAVFIVTGCTEPKGPEDTLAGIPTEAELVASAEASGLVRVTFPDPDPGIPSYARLGNILDQVFHNDTWLVIPFYREPSAVPGDFNLLSSFHFPGPDGPGAFAAPLLINGFYLIEAGAPMGTFPQVAISKGSAVPVWFVAWPTFAAAAADNVVTMDELRAMQPLEGTATQFTETLRPREGEHLLVLNAKGTLADGRRFDVHITHVEDTTRSLRIEIR